MILEYIGFIITLYVFIAVPQQKDSNQSKVSKCSQQNGHRYVEFKFKFQNLKFFIQNLHA